jgi:hypothetical protein
MPDYHVKISGKSDHHALQNLSSNTDVNFSRTDNKSRYFTEGVKIIENSSWTICYPVKFQSHISTGST